MFKFINKIQNSDEETRKIWMFIFSGVTMAIVIGFWLLYMNVTIARPDAPAGSNQFAGQVVPPVALNDPRSAILDPRYTMRDTRSEDPGFFAIFAAGVKVIYDQFKTKVFDATNDISIDNDRNFQVDDLETVPVTKLP
jgi:hypothetical protein